PDWGSEQTAECSYRYSVSIVEVYGGDPDQPITVIGHSAGASAILERRSRSPERIRPARIEAYECAAVALFRDPLSPLSRSVVT
ncbi:MAG: carboxylesterase family protein, partial [Acidimicrobiia bacterium]|nr:carboxylesterase family protein [Acidimicrobiia bacterium]